jgi:hypothetical protein
MLVITICTLWAIEGLFQVLWIAWLLADAFEAQSPDVSVALIPRSALLGFIAFLFLCISIQTYRGTGHGILWAGIGSLIYGYLMLPTGRRRVLHEFQLWYLTNAGTCFAVGILALLGNRKYKAWREALNAYRAAK